MSHDIGDTRTHGTWVRVFFIFGRAPAPREGMMGDERCSAPEGEEVATA
jgi:hypothetical protein